MIKSFSTYSPNKLKHPNATTWKPWRFYFYGTKSLNESDNLLLAINQTEGHTQHAWERTCVWRLLPHHITFCSI
jgi:hypothetical protein